MYMAPIYSYNLRERISLTLPYDGDLQGKGNKNMLTYLFFVISSSSHDVSIKLYYIPYSKLPVQNTLQ